MPPKDPKPEATPDTVPILQKAQEEYDSLVKKVKDKQSELHLESEKLASIKAEVASERDVLKKVKGEVKYSKDALSNLNQDSEKAYNKAESDLSKLHEDTYKALDAKAKVLDKVAKEADDKLVEAKKHYAAADKKLDEAVDLEAKNDKEKRSVAAELDRVKEKDVELDKREVEMGTKQVDYNKQSDPDREEKIAAKEEYNDALEKALTEAQEEVKKKPAKKKPAKKEEE